MRKALVFSIFLHVAVGVFAWFGLPVKTTPLAEPVQIIAVEIAMETVTPERVAEVPKQTRQPEEPPPPPPEEEPQVAALPPPKPPAPKTVPIEPEPAPVPIPVEKPPEKPDPVRPARAKPKPPPLKEEDFVESMMKAIEPLEDKTPQKTPEKTETDDLLGDLAALLSDDKQPRAEAQQAPILGNKLTVSEIDAVRRQIEPCWNVQIGARNPEDLVVDVKLYMNRDGSVRKAEVVNSARMRTDAFFRAAAESAQRAVQNNRCTPLKLPRDKYDRWRTLVLRFDPSKMVGQ